MKFLASMTLAASLATLVAVPAAAEPVQLTLTVDVSDIDGSTPAGAERITQRIEDKVERACERPFLRDLGAMRDFNDCVASARDLTNEKLALADTPSAG